MSRPTLRQAIDTFLSNRAADSPYLIARYSTSLETQVMTTREGEPTDTPGEYTDGQQTWKDKRWPYQAGSEPTYNDPLLDFSPADKVERVGTTWWNFEAKRSVAVGIDIDYSEGHASTTNTNDEITLTEIVDKLSALDYVSIVRSTGGKGLHVYVFFDPKNLPESQNHHEHTIVARKTLELIGKDIGYDLKQNVDCVGSVFWIWSKSSPADHPGFELVKDGSYLDATRLAKISLPQPAVRGQAVTDFEVTELEEEHKRVVEALATFGYMGLRADMNLIHTHTGAIAKAVGEGLIAGKFTTDSDVTDLSSPNCFLAPQPGGSFRCVRFGQTQHEKGEGWHFRNGKNYCFINEKKADLEILSQHSDQRRNGKYKIPAEEIAGLLADFGVEVKPENLPATDVWADLTSVGDLRFEASEEVKGWTTKGKKSTKTFTLEKKGSPLRDRVLQMADDHIRYVIQDGKEKGWYHRTEDGQWILHRSFADVACVIDDLFPDFSKKARHILHTNPWNMLKIPFKEEYPGGRVWNYDAPQLKVAPSISGGDHPHYDMILDHIGLELNAPVAVNDWCRKANIQTGADYLRAWLASLIHYVDQPLPYLFLTGPQNSGKSIFHESCRYLFTHGITSANNSLTSQFNGELEGCFLVYVEERDLADKRYNAYEKIKEWVTGRDLTVRPLYQQTYSAPNYLHFVQMANSTEHLPLEDGDTRIVAIEVPALKKPVPKAILEGHLKKEAPRFLRTLINTQLPPPVDRLRIPALQTITKSAMEQKAMSPVMDAARTLLFPRVGHVVEVPAFYEKYKKMVKDAGVDAEPDFLVTRELSMRSDRYELGARNKKQYIVNVSMDPLAKDKKTPIVVDSSGRF